jgi:hypothetical protein
MRTAPLSSAPVAVRMRLHRKRRRKGMRCVPVEIHDDCIEGLVRKGYLEPPSRNDRDALAFAVSCFINDALTTMS